MEIGEEEGELEREVNFDFGQKESKPVYKVQQKGAQSK